MAQGKLPAALNSYQASLAIMERLAKSDPGNAAWQSDLALLQKTGDVQVAQGNLPAALTILSGKPRDADRLAKSDPSNTTWQHDLAVDYARLAQVYWMAKQPPKEREALVSGHAIISRLVAQYPERTQWKQDLAVFDQKIAELKE